MRTDQARTISIVEYLAAEGHKPAYTRREGREVWYRSPLRADDNTPSFKVDALINKWFDHGLAEGGNTLDLVVALRRCTVAEALSILDQTGLYRQGGYSPRRGGLRPSFGMPGAENAATSEKEKSGKAFQFLSEKPLSHPALLQYLEKTRKISISVAHRFLKEIRFKPSNGELREYFALGWFNGVSWEARNALFKGVVGEGKEINCLNLKDGNDCYIFEGFMNFLTLLSHKAIDIQSTSFIILNSVSLRSKLEEVFKEYKFRQVYLYLDHDESGRVATEYIKALLPPKMTVDKSPDYMGYNDYNAWWMEQANGD